MGFLFTCKPASHPWLSETKERSYWGEKKGRGWAGRYHQSITYRRINGAPLRGSKDALMANYLYLQIRNEKAGKAVYTNGWVTGKEINAEDAEHLTLCAMAGWKIENERNKVLKNRDTGLNINSAMGNSMLRKYSCCRTYCHSGSTRYWDSATRGIKGSVVLCGGGTAFFTICSGL